eukprot:4057502-Pyramimonas_sp.AAC.1
MPAQSLRRARGSESVIAIAAASGVANHLADLISAPSWANTVSYVVGGAGGNGHAMLDSLELA